MRQHWEQEQGEGTRRPRRRGRHRHRRERSEAEQAYRDAARRANLKLSFVGHFVTYALVCTFLLLVTGFRAAFIVALAWGIGLGCHYFFAIVAPDLRRRFIAKEVSREVETGVSRARRSIEDRHARSLEQLSASIAHEIRNPITAAKSLVQQMGEDPASKESIAYANVALEELDRVERSISHLLRFAREEEISLGTIRLRDVLESALETFRDRLAHSGIAVELDLGTDGDMRGDAEKLRRVLINLIGNALDSLQEGTVADPAIQISAGENLAGSEVWLRVRDNGPGIDPDSLGKIFSPFYTSKSKGTGLGLAISKKVVDAHGGAIEVHSSPGSGAEFLLTFPKHARDPEA